MRDTGLLTIYSLSNTAEAGEKPVEQLVEVTTAYYSERTVGYGRMYAAMGANIKIDALVRCWMTSIPEDGKYVILEDDNQYRIAQMQKIIDEDAVDLTLERLEANYDVYSG